MDHGVLAKTGDTPAQSASDEDVAAFEKDHSGGPVAGQTVKMHWKSGFASSWNRQALFVLASAFSEEHPSCGIPLAGLQVLFGRKLERTRQEWINVKTMQPDDVDRRRAQATKKNRRKGRLLGVSISLIFY